tara:strand:+ start:529 stop:825 length:297 start_codon:yes stop_codon:yes gene_type:complete
METMGIISFRLNDGVAGILGKKRFDPVRTASWTFTGDSFGVTVVVPGKDTYFYPWSSVSWAKVDTITLKEVEPKKRRRRSTKPKVVVVEAVEVAEAVA